MGWNTGFTIFEATVVGAYDLGKLDKEMLSVLMGPYRDTDIDSGGREGLTSKDGKEIEQIVIEALGLEMPKRPDGKRDDTEEWWSYDEAAYDKFREITKNFGW